MAQAADAVLHKEEKKPSRYTQQAPVQSVTAAKGKLPPLYIRLLLIEGVLYPQCVDKIGKPAQFAQKFLA